MATLSFINWVTRGQKVHNRLIKLSLVSVACAMPHTLLDVSLGVNNWFFSEVLLRRHILKGQLLHQIFVRNLLFLVCCFFSVIWNISQKNVFETTCKSKSQKEFFGKLFLKSGNTSVYLFTFFSLRFIWRTIDVIIDNPYLTS